MVVFPMCPVAVVQTTSKGLSTGSIVGIVVGAVAFVAILAAFATFLILLRHRKKQRRLRAGTLPPGVKIAGVKGFTYEELAKASKGFSPENEIGQGGYGKVYRGTLEDDTIVGIKRALKESMQGAHQFYTEIELLSRLHHRNLVQLIGYCNDKGEQVSISPSHHPSFQVFILQLSSSIHGSKSIQGLHNVVCNGQKCVFLSCPHLVSTHNMLFS
jgi:hypothetical protein